MAEAIASSTAQADSSSITLSSGASIQVTADPKLSGDEKVILLHAPDGTNFEPCSTPQGCDVLTAAINRNTITGPITFRLRKTATKQNTSVDYDS
jgi:hypothetical protein